MTVVLMFSTAAWGGEWSEMGMSSRWRSDLQVSSGRAVNSPQGPKPESKAVTLSSADIGGKFAANMLCTSR